MLSINPTGFDNTTKGQPQMNTQVKVGIASVVAAAAVTVGIVLPAQPAWAPQMVGVELAAQRTLGYSPCEPTVSQLPAELEAERVAADAAPDFMFQRCEIRFASNIPTEDLGWVAWHEACHLSTMRNIWADPHRPLVDPAHRHVLFLQCISYGPAETGGYL